MLKRSPWVLYSKKVCERIEKPRFVGSFTTEEAKARQMRLAIGREGTALALYLLVDETDGIIADAKFQASGPTALLAAADGGCELLLRKNYDQARRITAELLDRQLRDKREQEAFPPESAPYLNKVLSAMEAAAEQCLDIPITEPYTTPTMGLDIPSSGGFPEWKTLPMPEKIAILEEVIAREIRPYIELDAGGVQIVNIVNELEVIIAYQGSCTSCYSATGATLSAIQQILQTKIDPAITVTPDLSTVI